MPRLVVIGGNAAGMSAASKVARSGRGWEVCVFESSPHVSYGACGLPYLFSGEAAGEGSLFALSREEISSRGIEASTGELAVELLRGRKRVAVRNLNSGETREESYDELVIATGSEAVTPELPGFEGENLFRLHTMADALRLRRFMAMEKVYSATILGGGHVGLEMADCLHAAGVKVNLVLRSETFLRKLHPELSRMLAERMESRGVRLYSGSPVTSVKKDGDRVAAFGTGGREVYSDIFICATGVRPSTSFLEGSGLPLGKGGAITVDERCRTALPSIWACGDCCEVRNLVTGKHGYYPLGTTANKMGRVAGTNIAGDREEFRGVLGTSILRAFGLEIAMTGLTAVEAGREGFAAVETLVTGRSRPSYMKEGGDVSVSVVAGKDGKVLGGQVMGMEGAKGRIDVLAAVILGGIRIGEAKHMDLAYAPPFSTVWDPLLTAFSLLDRGPGHP